MNEQNKEPRWELPPHINAEPHRKLMERLAKMSDEERIKYLFDISVKAGIYTPDGELTEHYKDTSEPTSQTA